MDLSLMLMGVDFCVGNLFDPQQLLGPDCHFAHFKGGVVFSESEILHCLDNFIVAPPHTV